VKFPLHPAQLIGKGRISKWKVAGGPGKSKRNESGKKRLQKEEKQNK
jgi:hypothetical protein